MALSEPVPGVAGGRSPTRDVGIFLAANICVEGMELMHLATYNGLVESRPEVINVPDGGLADAHIRFSERTRRSL